jgi:predicted MPP superfamily phosphohydrolase
MAYLSIAGAILMYLTVNLYVILRGWTFLSANFDLINKTIYLGILILISLTFFIYMSFLRKYPSLISKFFMHLGHYWLVILLYSFLFIAMVDILRSVLLFIRPLNKILGIQNQWIYIVGGRSWIVLMIAIFMIGLFLAQSTKITKYQIHVSKTPKGMDSLKVVMISDVHLGDMIGRDRFRRIVDKINEREPDLVLFVGDIFDGDIRPVLEKNMLEEAKRLKPKYGTYGVLGNHEFYGVRYYNNMKEGVDKIIDVLHEAGIHILRDEHILLDESFYLIGRLDVQSRMIKGENRKKLDILLEGVESSKPMFLMDHQPLEIEAVSKTAVDLQLSGHTHKGQLWPLSFISKKIYGHDWGLLVKENTNFIVSSGVGTWGPLVRIGSRSEIVEIDVTFDLSNEYN